MFAPGSYPFGGSNGMLPEAGQNPLSHSNAEPIWQHGIHAKRKSELVDEGGGELHHLLKDSCYISPEKRLRRDLPISELLHTQPPNQQAQPLSPNATQSFFVDPPGQSGMERPSCTDGTSSTVGASSGQMALVPYAGSNRAAAGLPALTDQGRLTPFGVRILKGDAMGAAAASLLFPGALGGLAHGKPIQVQGGRSLTEALDLANLRGFDSTAIGAPRTPLYTQPSLALPLPAVFDVSSPQVEEEEMEDEADERQQCQSPFEVDSMEA